MFIKPFYSKDNYDVFRVESIASDDIIAKAFNEGKSGVCRFKTGITGFRITAYKGSDNDCSFIVEPSNPDGFKHDVSVRYVIRNNNTGHCSVMSKCGVTSSSEFINISCDFIKFISTKYIDELTTASDAAEFHINRGHTTFTDRELQLYKTDNHVLEVIEVCRRAKAKSEEFYKEYLKLIIHNQRQEVVNSAIIVLQMSPASVLKSMKDDIKSIVVESNNAHCYYRYLKTIEECQIESMEPIIASSASVSVEYCNHFRLDYDSFYKGCADDDEDRLMLNKLHRMKFYKENDFELFDKLKEEKNYCGLVRYASVSGLLKDEVIEILKSLDPSTKIEIDKMGSYDTHFIIAALLSSIK